MFNIFWFPKVLILNASMNTGIATLLKYLYYYELVIYE